MLNEENVQPLASRLRPTTLDEFYGQQHIVGKNTLLYRMIKANKISSIILYGDSGTGKTTLAKIISTSISGSNDNVFRKLNATMSGIKDIKEVVEEAKSTLALTRRKTVLFIDEIHRFNKSQQDSLLPYVEDGLIILIGATTENPYFEVNNALISRSTIFELKPLSTDDIKHIIMRALSNKEKGYGNLNIKLDDDALEFICDICNGDARVALNALELAVLTTDTVEGKIHITTEIMEQCTQKRVMPYDKDGDNHYNTTSAFIKSMRGSDPDASLHYLAKMLHSGEDVKFIARRIIICAAEDVGLADPNALKIAVSAMEAVNFVGMPEARIILSEAALYIACSPKSNAGYKAIDLALEDVKNIKTTVPSYLKDSAYKGAKKLGNGVGYKYAHAYEGHYVEQQYLPDELVGTKYYYPTSNGVERKIKESLERLRGQNE